MPNAVAGLTKKLAACSSGSADETGTACRAGMTTYCCQLPRWLLPLRTATRRPLTRQASSPEPASTTPTPSKPGVMGRGGCLPYWPRTVARSDGLIGLANMRTRTSPGPGSGTGTSLRTCKTCSGSPHCSQTMAFMRSRPSRFAGTVVGGLYREDSRPALFVDTSLAIRYVRDILPCRYAQRSADLAFPEVSDDGSYPTLSRNPLAFFCVRLPPRAAAPVFARPAFRH